MLTQRFFVKFKEKEKWSELWYCWENVAVYYVCRLLVWEISWVEIAFKKNSYPESGKKASCSHEKAVLFQFKEWNKKSSSRHSNYPRVMHLVLQIKREYILKNIRLHIKIIREPVPFNVISRIVCHTWLLQNNTPEVPREQSALPAPAGLWELLVWVLPMHTGCRNPGKASSPKSRT